ncbi:MAG: LytTR family DNA-binding domain-containing protein [Bacteroidota bacterium]
MNSLRVIIIDDEKSSSDRLVNLLNAHNLVCVTGVFDTLETALAGIRARKPEAIFLDVHLHNQTGFDLLRKLERIDFEIIFTTAHDRYAVDAFKFSAIDYLLKPIDADELANALHRLHERTHGKNLTARVENLLNNLNEKENKTIAIPTQEGLTFLDIHDIIRCHADANYTRLHLRNGAPMIVSKNLKQFEELLNPHGFFRVHHSSLINLEFIKKYNKGKGGIVFMSDGSEIEVSVRRKEPFMRKLEEMKIVF